MEKTSAAHRVRFEEARTSLHDYQTNHAQSSLTRGIQSATISLALCQPYTQPWVDSLCLLVALRYHQVVLSPNDDALLERTFSDMRQVAKGRWRGLTIPAYYLVAACELHMRRYARRGNLEDLDAAVSLSDTGSTTYKLRLEHLAQELLKRYSQNKTAESLERAIHRHQQLVDIIGQEQSFDEQQVLGWLWLQMSDFKMSLDVLNTAEKFASFGFRKYNGQDARSLQARKDLADILVRRFSINKDVKDLRKAQLLMEEATEDATHRDFADYELLNLKFIVLTKLAEHTGELEILQQAADLAKRTVQITLSYGTDDYRHVIAAINFGDIVMKLPRTDQRQADVQSAIQYLAQVQTSTDNETEHYDLVLATHSSLLLWMFYASSNQKYLNAALDMIDQAIKICELRSQPNAKYLLKRAMILVQEARIKKQTQAWEAALEQFTAAAELRPTNSIDMGDILYGLCETQFELFLRQPEAIYIQNAIEQGHRALELYGKGRNQRHQAHGANILSEAYFARFQIERGSDDLRESIRHAETATSDEANPSQVTYLSNLATRLRARALENQSREDIEKALMHTRRARELEESMGKRSVTTFGTLTLVLLDTMRITKTDVYMAESFSSAERWLSISTPWDRNHLLGLRTEGELYHFRYIQGHLPSDLETAIEKAQEVMSALTPRDASEADVLDILGSWLQESDALQSNPEHRQQAKEVCLRAATLNNGSPARRIRAARMAAYLHDTDEEYSQAFDCYKIAIDLFPKLSPRVLPRSDQQAILSTVRGTATLAATCAISAGLGAQAALAIIEAGRGIISSWLIQSRSDVGILSDSYPRQAQRYQELLSFLSSGVPGSLREVEPQHSLEDAADFAESFGINSYALSNKRRRNFIILEELENEIRSQKGFENFQRPLSAGDCVALASNVPVVVLNVNGHGAHIFIVTKSGIETLAAPALLDDTFPDSIADLFYNSPVARGPVSTRAVRNARLRQFLGFLWDHVGEPVLRALKYLDRPAPKQQRIIWLTNGTASLCPLHAAGYYVGQSTKYMARYATCSYTTSFRALKFSRERSLRPATLAGSPPLILAMEKTVGQNDLLAQRESSAIKNIFSAAKSRVPDVVFSPSRQGALKIIGSREIVHFACHGYTNAEDPSKSHLLLHDTAVPGQPDELSVDDLAAISSKSAQIAFLSACSTAEPALPRFFDENIHLTASLQLAGFSHVIGTLWSVGDLTAIDIASAFYEHLLAGSGNGAVDPAAVPYALHEAVRLLRETKPPGSRLRPAEDVLSWVPFVHFGC